MVAFILYIGYAFWYDHKNDIGNSDFESIFREKGLSQKNIDKISHDDDMWYHGNKSTCVGYSSDENEECPKFQEVCVGGKTFGSIERQINEVIKAVRNGGTHEDCPLVYEGAD